MGVQKAWIDRPWKLIETGKEALLFNLTTDPGEQHNLLKANQRRVVNLRKALRKALAASVRDNVRELDPEIKDTELREQLRALGYID